MLVSVMKCVPVPSEPTLVTSGGPKRREKASWLSSVASWPRSTKTEWSSKAARAAAYTVSSAAMSASVTPRSSAAKPGPSGTMSIGKSSPVYCSARLLAPDVRIELPCRRQVGLGAGLVALLFFGETPIVESARMVGIELDRLVEVLDGAVVLASVVVGDAAVAKSESEAFPL